jgi:general secretion pathway protein D
MMDVGVLLGVTPRISPGDGLVVMEIDASRSEVGPEEQGTPVAVSEGQIIRSPRIERTYAQTTVSAMSGQTVVLGGLIAKSKEELHRKVPLLGDIPLLGRLFRYDSISCTRTELMIIMTPHIVRNEADADAIKQTEAARMSWCLSDVVSIHGDGGLRGRRDDWTDAETQVVYPDMKPDDGLDGKPLVPEAIPAPEGAPTEKPKK